jgi:RimJ/RimL family protein N-acetyltransferase
MPIDVRHYAEAIVLRNGRTALLRAIRPDDRDRLATAFLGLEPESVYLRYFSYKHELTPADLDRLCVPDFRERVVLVVTLGSGAEEIVIGAGGYVAHAGADGRRVAEVAFAVEEDFHGQGIAGKLLAVLIDMARQDGIACFEAEVLARNAPMLQVFARSGLPMQRTHSEDGVVSVSMALVAPNPAGASQ